MKAHCGSRYSSTLSLTSALDGGGWSTQAAAVLSPGERPVSHYAGGRCGGFRNIFRPHPDSIPGPSNLWQVAIQTTLSRPTWVRVFEEKFLTLLGKVPLCIYENSFKRYEICLEVACRQFEALAWNKYGNPLEEEEEGETQISRQGKASYETMLPWPQCARMIN